MGQASSGGATQGIQEESTLKWTLRTLLDFSTTMAPFQLVADYLNFTNSVLLGKYVNGLWSHCAIEDLPVVIMSLLLVILPVFLSSQLLRRVHGSTEILMRIRGLLCLAALGFWVILAAVPLHSLHFLANSSGIAFFFANRNLNAIYRLGRRFGPPLMRYSICALFVLPQFFNQQIAWLRPKNILLVLHDTSPDFELEERQNLQRHYLPQVCPIRLQMPRCVWHEGVIIERCHRRDLDASFDRSL